MKKIDFPIDKKKWHPSLIPGTIVLISTCDSKKNANIAPKSWLQMVSFNPPILMFSGTKGNTTENNILKSQCFGVNFVDSSLSSKVFGCIKWHGQERIDKTEFTFIKASKIDCFLVDECKAHIECQLHSVKEVGSGFVIFGEIVTASIWKKIINVDPEKRYNLLDQIVFLEEGIFSRINKITYVKF